MLDTKTAPHDATELALIARTFGPMLRDDDLYALLAYLNQTTAYRFTGVYRFEPGWVVSVSLYDRENPSLRLGADVKMKESYCWLTGLSGVPYVIEDAACDPRLSGHAASEDVRAYIAVLLRDTGGFPWGTLCHFDFQPRARDDQAIERLGALRPLVEEMFVREKRAIWSPDSPSNPRSVPRGEDRLSR